DQDERSRKSGGLSRPPDEWPMTWSQTLRHAVQQGQRAAERAPLFSVSEFIRRAQAAAVLARRLATEMGTEDPRTWPLLERAARVEIDGLCAETELDTIMADGRIDRGGA